MLLSQALSKSMVFNQALPHEVSDYVNSYVGNHHIEVNSKPQARASLHFREFANMGLSRIRYGNATKVICPDLEEVYHFQLVVRGQCRWHMQDENILLGEGQAFMLNPQQDYALHYSDDCEKIIVRIPRQLLNNAGLEYAAALPRQGIEFARKSLTCANTLAFMRLFEAILHEAEEDSVDLGKVDASYRDLLLAKLLHSFPNNLTVTSPNLVQDRNIGRALEFIQQNIKEEVPVEALAEHCNVSPRTLYNLFAKHLDTTPKQYIKHARLKELQHKIRHDPKIRNVTEAALDYGFTHLGRFASDYRRLFGELPSETLRHRYS